jgi:uncharacterized membrane protein SirB2
METTKIEEEIAKRELFFTRAMMIAVRGIMVFAPLSILFISIFLTIATQSILGNFTIVERIVHIPAFLALQVLAYVSTGGFVISSCSLCFLQWLRKLINNSSDDQSERKMKKIIKWVGDTLYLLGGIVTMMALLGGVAEHTVSAQILGIPIFAIWSVVAGIGTALVGVATCRLSRAVSKTAQ